MDGDGILNAVCDNCAGPNPGLQWSNPWQEDYDGDGIGNSCDPCPLSTQSPCPASPEPPVAQPSIVDVWSSTVPVITLAELHIYGSDRLGMYLPNEPRDTAQLVNVVSFVRTLRKREYELKDHLGNVRVTVSDLKLGNGTPIYNADIRSYTNHYAFGMVQPDRSWVAGGGYRYGFNGKESDNEISGNGNQYDYGFRIYNPRIARFLSEDPLTKEYPMLTPYQFASNTPIQAIDLDGLEAFYTPTGELIGQYGDNTDIKIVNWSFIEQAKQSFNEPDKINKFIDQDINTKIHAPYKTMDEAAYGWAEKYNYFSVAENREYGSTFYEIEINGSKYIEYSQPNTGPAKEVKAGLDNEPGDLFVARSLPPEGFEDNIGFIHSHGRLGGAHPSRKDIGHKDAKIRETMIHQGYLGHDIGYVGYVSGASGIITKTTVISGKNGEKDVKTINGKKTVKGYHEWYKKLGETEKIKQDQAEQYHKFDMSKYK